MGPLATLIQGRALLDLAKEHFMKAAISIILVLGLSLFVAAQNQGSSQSQGSSQQDNGQMKQNSQASQTNTSGQNMSGKVSHDGKTFVNDADNQSYRIGNPDALQGKADQHVALVVHVDPDTNVIHIMQVAMPQQ
jgi:hypothetical protein